MKSIIYKISVSVFLLLAVIQAQAQQSIQLTQYIFNSISVNPAYTGYKEEWFVQVGLRSQWTGLSGAPKTGTVSIDGVLGDGKRHGLGLSITTDGLGAQAATSIYGNYAFRIQLNEDDTQRLSFGVAAGLTQYSLDGTKLDPNDKDDPTVPKVSISDWAPDIRLGVYYYSPQWYAGVSVQDLFSETNSNQDYRFNTAGNASLYRKVSLYLITGALFELSEGLHLRPSVLLKDDFKGPTALDASAMFIFNRKLWIGGGYRTRARLFSRAYDSMSPAKLTAMNALTGIAQFYVTGRLRIGYSYDQMLNKLSGLQNGTHEITLGYTFGQKELKQVLSPRFF